MSSAEADSNQMAHSNPTAGTSSMTIKPCWSARSISSSEYCEQNKTKIGSVCSCTRSSTRSSARSSACSSAAEKQKKSYGIVARAERVGAGPAHQIEVLGQRHQIQTAAAQLMEPNKK